MIMEEPDGKLISHGMVSLYRQGYGLLLPVFIFRGILYGKSIYCN